MFLRTLSRRTQSRRTQSHRNPSHRTLSLRTPVYPIALVLAILCAPSPPVSAVTFIAVDGVNCTLPDAIHAANLDAPVGGCAQGSGPDTIVLDADVTLSDVDAGASFLSGGRPALPDVVGDLTIRNGLASVIRRDPALECSADTTDPVFRFLNHGSGVLTLQGLSFEDGCFVGEESAVRGAGTPERGGGVLSMSADGVVLIDVTVRRHQMYSEVDLEGGFLANMFGPTEWTGGGVEDSGAVSGADVAGGAVYQDSGAGSLTLRNTTFDEFTATGGEDVNGGVIWAQSSVLDGLTIRDVTASAANALAGGAVLLEQPVDIHELMDVDIANVLALADGGAAAGGALSVRGAASATGVALSDVTSAGATCSGGALYASGSSSWEDLVIDGAACISQTATFGGGAFLENVSQLRNCSVSDSLAMFSASSAGYGGGIILLGTIGVVERCSFSHNTLRSGGDGGGFGSGAAFGGGVYVGGDVQRLSNLTIVGNRAEGAPVDVVERSSSRGGSAFGGGLIVSGDIPEAWHLTVSENVAVAGRGGDNQALARGAGVFVDGKGGSLHLGNSILVDNTVDPASGGSGDEDCYGGPVFLSFGRNLVGTTHSSCDFSATGDLVGVDPQLYPLGDHGCTTALPGGACVSTQAIDQDSMATDWASCKDASETQDARGLGRPEDIAGVSNQDDGCDAGAYEAMDTDGDGFTDVADVCPATVDDQSDADGDGVGDACDVCFGDNASGDTDGDGLCNDLDVLAEVGDRVWLDADQNGLQDSGEVGLAGIVVNLYALAGPKRPSTPGSGGTLVETMTTNGDGLYRFEVTPGQYYLEIPCTSESFTAPYQGSNANNDSDFYPQTGTTEILNMMAGRANLRRDAGLLDPDLDGVACSDNCPSDANASQEDADLDGVGDACDLCFGDQSTGDGDGDGLCADVDCNDADAGNACLIFADGFESGNAESWM